MKPSSPAPGAVIVQANLLGTLLFVVSAVAARRDLRGHGAGGSQQRCPLGLFFAGIVAFGWSFWNAVQRSRSEQVAVTQLYLLLGTVAPSSVRRPMLAALGCPVLRGAGHSDRTGQRARWQPRNLAGAGRTRAAVRFRPQRSVGGLSW